MKLAAVASDSSILTAIRAARSVSSLDIDLLWSENSELLGEMSDLAPQATRCLSWDEILNPAGLDLDAVLVAGVSPSILAAARQFVLAGQPILVLISTQGDLARLFDFTAIWQEGSQMVIPIFLSGVEQISQTLYKQFDTSRLGRLWKIEFERNLSSDPENAGLTLELASGWFLQDCSWLRNLDQRATHISMESTGLDPSFPSEVTARLTGPDAPDIRWLIRCHSNSDWKLAFIGESGQISVQLTTSGIDILEAPYSLEITPSDDLILEDVAAQLRSFSEPQNAHNQRTWSEVIKLGEFGATARRSLLKRRTLPVHFEEASERSQFKSQMAAIGCGALLWTMFGMIALLAFGAVTDPRDREYLTSSSAGFVIWSTEFQEDSPSELSTEGRIHLEEVTRSWSESSPMLIVEKLGRDPVNESRKETVIAVLESMQLRNPGERVVLRSIEGQWFEWVMLIGWSLVFLPITLVLLAQLLLLVSRPMGD